MKTIQTLKDVLTMSGRCLLLSKRNPDTILTSIIAPILTMLLFAYVIGGAMQTGETSYVNFIVPGIILQCLGQCAATTAIAVCSDIKSGIMERFCTMPVKRSSILNGHVLEAFIRNMVTALLILLVAFLIGFRPEADLLGWCAALLIISLYILLDIRIFRNDCQQSGGGRLILNSGDCSALHQLRLRTNRHHAESNADFCRIPADYPCH